MSRTTRHAAHSRSIQNGMNMYSATPLRYAQNDEGES